MSEENTTKTTIAVEPSKEVVATKEISKPVREFYPRPDFRPRDEWDQKVLDIARTTRVTAGGKRFSFRATVVVGDGKGRVGVGTGKSWDLQKAVEKGTNKAKKQAITLALKGNTIPYEVKTKYASAVVLLKPASPGSGVKAGGPIRVIAKLGGIRDLSAKLVSRTNNKINIARATIEALKGLKIKEKSKKQE